MPLFAVCRTRGDQKFFTAPAHQNVGAAHHPQQALGSTRERGVSRVMSETVVDLLEVVNIGQIKNQIAMVGAMRRVRIVTDGLISISLNGGLEEAPVADSSQRIGQ